MSRSARQGFTLIELLVVVAIIALLVSILLPSLAMARAHGKAVKCAANLKNVGTAMAGYTCTFGPYPPSYVYATDDRANYRFYNQDPNHPYGYVHWSYFLYGAGKVKDDAFECPALTDGGAPRTNPGPEAKHWESGQYDQNGMDRATPTSVEDKQAPRMAYMANAAICPRNKFDKVVLPGARRLNRLVIDAEIKMPGHTILATEFHQKWQNVAMPDDKTGMLTSKSHRSLSPFSSLFSGFGRGSTKEGAEYDVPAATASFVYGTGGTKNNFGLLPTEKLDKTENLISGDTVMPINVIGRHHPGGLDKEFTGTANFLYCDAHVARKNVLETMVLNEWGDKYYSLTGESGVLGRGEVIGDPTTPH